MLKTSQLFPMDREWFTFTCEGGSFRVLLQRMKPGEAEKIRKEYTRVDGRGGEVFDMKKWIGILADRVLIGWEGVTDDAGVEWPCTRDNKIKLFNEVADFGKFVNDQLLNDDAFRGKVVGGDDSLTAGSPPQD